MPDNLRQTSVRLSKLVLSYFGRRLRDFLGLQIGVCSKILINSSSGRSNRRAMTCKAVTDVLGCRAVTGVELGQALQTVEM